MNFTFNILYEDNDIIVCEKPPGVPAQSDKSADFDMVNRLKNYIFEKEQKQPYIGLIHRLDRPVGGIMLFAKAPNIAKELSEQVRLKKIIKKYLAVTTSDLSSELGKDKVLLIDYIVKDGRTNLSKITNDKDKNGKKAELYYRTVEVIDNLNEVNNNMIDENNVNNMNDENNVHDKNIMNDKNQNKLSLVEVELLTGRHHQIRIQMASRGNPLWGDTKYNPMFTNHENSNPVLNSKRWTNVALYAYQLEFSHPKTKKWMKFQLLPNVEPFNYFNHLDN